MTTAKVKKDNTYIYAVVCFIAAVVCLAIYLIVQAAGSSTPTTAPAPIPEPAPAPAVPRNVQYDFVPKYDSSGGDIGKKNGSIDELKVLCTADPNCKGFNSNGWLKNTIKPSSEWKKWTDDDKLGFYTKA